MGGARTGLTRLCHRCAKALFRLGDPEALRLCVTEAAIDAMSLAAIARPDLFGRRFAYAFTQEDFSMSNDDPFTLDLFGNTALSSGLGLGVTAFGSDFGAEDLADERPAAPAAPDAIIITHPAFRFISVPSAFEQQMIQDELELYETLLTKVESDDRVSRKRLERLKEGLKERLESLATRKDDLLTTSEIGVDQIIVDEAQEFHNYPSPPTCRP